MIDNETRAVARENYEDTLSRFNEWCGDILTSDMKERMLRVMEARLGVLDPEHPDYEELISVTTVAHQNRPRKVSA